MWIWGIATKKIEAFEIFNIQLRDHLDLAELGDEENDEEITFYDVEKLNNLRDNSFLIESLKNKLCLYGNKGIDNITHSNYKVISDREIIFQALRKIKINTMGTLSLNSEKIIGSCEEDITLISNLGDINLGGDGVTDLIGSGTSSMSGILTVLTELTIAEHVFLCE